MAWNWLSDRTPGYQAIADRLNLEFAEKDTDKAALASHKGFNLFSQGGSKKIKYLLQGWTAHQEPLSIFEYSYTVSTGKTTSTYTQHVYSVSLKQPLPPFRLKPQHIFHQIGKWFGMQDIEFAAYPEFNKLYLVKGADEQQIRSLFSDAFLGFLNYEQEWCIECIGTKVIYYKFSKRMNEELVEPFIQVARSLHDLLAAGKSIDDLTELRV